MSNIKNINISHWPITLLNGIAALLSVAIPMFASRFLIGSEIGKYKIMFLYLSMVPALSFSGGIENGIYYWSGLVHNAKEKIRSAWSMALLQAIIFFSCLVIFSPFIRPWLNWSWEQYTPFLLASLAIVLSTMYEAILISRKKILAGALFASFFNTLNTLVILLAIIFFKTAVMVFWAGAIIIVLKVTIAYILGTKEGWIPKTFDFKEASSVRKYYVPVSTSGIFAFLMYYSDRLLLSLLISPAQFASYTFGCLAIPPLQILETAVNQVMIPQLTVAIEANDKTHAASLYNRGLAEIMLFSIPSFVGLLIFAEPIMQLLFTEKYLDAAPYLRIYAIWILLSGIPYDVAARASGNGQWILKNTVRIGSFSILICSLLAWQFGPYGALIAMIITILIQKASGFHLMINTYGWSVKEMIPLKSLLLYAGLSAALGFISLLLKNYFNNKLYWFIYCGLAFALIYLVAIFFIQKNSFRELPFVQKIYKFFSEIKLSMS